MIYLATPYWHDDEKIRRQRAHAAIYITRAFIRRGVAMFSPIAHSYALLEEFGPLPLTNAQWADQCLGYLERSSYMLVAQIDGWQQSKGVEKEVLYCNSRGIPVTYMNSVSSDSIISAEMNISAA